MKKTTVLFTTILLAGMVGLPATSRAAGRSHRMLLAGPAAASPAPVPAAAQKPQWSSRAEYDAFQAFVKETDAQKRIPLIQAFIQKYPKSDFLANAYVAQMQTYAQMGASHVDDASAAAKKALELDPNNLLALAYLSYTFPYTYKSSAPNAQDELSQGASNAQHGLQVLQSMQTPAGMSPAQFENTIKADRATFNVAVGFAALQQKNYSQAIKSLEAATQDQPKNVLAYSLLGQAYYNETPREADKAIWNLARAATLAADANSPNQAQLKKFYSQVYEAQHGSNEGEDQVLAQAKSSETMPADFKVATPPHHATTGNPNLDAFYKIEDALAVGGDTAQQNWAQLKGQPLGLVGHVDSVEPGADPNTYLVRVDITPQSQSQEGTYDIVLQESQANAKYLQPGDPLRFQGTITAYSMTPNFNLTLSGAKIDESVLKAAQEKAAAAAQAAKEKKAARKPRR